MLICLDREAHLGSLGEIGRDTTQSLPAKTVRKKLEEDMNWMSGLCSAIIGFCLACVLIRFRFLFWVSLLSIIVVVVSGDSVGVMMVVVLLSLLYFLLHHFCFHQIIERERKTAIT